jgi:long-chain acyl-CoA synthetase
MDTIPEILTHGVRSYGDRVAFRRHGGSDAETHSYRGVGLLAAAMGHRLAARGVTKGAPVALLCENRPEWAVAYFAIHLVGGICVPIDTALSPQEIRAILDRCGGRVLIVSRRFLRAGQEACEGGTEAKTIALLDELLPDVEARVRTDPSRLTGGKVSGDDVAVISFTSGTTGRSKAVVLTHRNITSNAVSGARRLGVLPDDRLLSILPLHHLFEQTGGLLVPFVSGANVTYPGSLNPRTILQAMQDSGTTIMLLVPAMVRLFQKRILSAVQSERARRRWLFSAARGFARIARRAKVPMGKMLFKDIHRRFGGKVRFFVSGGAPLDPRLAEFFSDLALPVLQGYGLSEAAPIVACNTVDRNVVGSVGRPLPGIEVKISAIDGREGGTGEILVRGPNVTGGYFEDPEATAETIRDGWLRTGDLGKLDRNGYLHVIGRAKDVIVGESGKNIYPEEIEAEIIRSSYVREVCVLGIRPPGGDTYTEEVAALICPDPEMFGREYSSEHDELLQGELQKVCASLVSYKRPRYFAVWAGEFPRTATLKLKKHEIRDGLDGVALRPLYSLSGR